MSQPFKQNYLQRLPAVEKILQNKALEHLKSEVPRVVLLETVQEVINEKRALIRKAASLKELEILNLNHEAIVKEVAGIVQDKLALNLRPVINGTGVLLHTNLGRSPLARSALEAVQQVGSSYNNLELSLQTGKRSSRYEHLEKLICRVTGAEGAMVVNNNAGAVFLALNTLAAKKEVIVSRGELVEIGGSFRIPEVMEKSGARLVEVGTTNKCYLKDYRKAIGEKTALLLKVHTSNYKILGFTAGVQLKSLVRMAKEYSLPVMDDLGSGVLIDLSRYGLPYEPTVQEAVASGADVVTFSGDKLLGGPQAGLIAGKKESIELIKSNQLTRALRVDKLTLAALEATLRLYLDEKKALAEIPILQMMTLPVSLIKERAETMAATLKDRSAGRYSTGISSEKARVGGGSLPLVALPSHQVFLEPGDYSAGALAARLRRALPPVVARVKQNRVLFDLRSVRAEEDELLLRAILETL